VAIRAYQRRPPDHDEHDSRVHPELRLGDYPDDDNYPGAGLADPEHFHEEHAEDGQTVAAG
jgi:hypothetical protein